MTTDVVLLRSHSEVGFPDREDVFPMHAKFKKPELNNITAHIKALQVA